MISAKTYILDIAPYVGGDVTPAGMTRRIVLASNESPLGPSPRVLEFMQNLPLNLSSYPSGGASKLKEALSGVHNIPRDHIICGNGSEDIIHLICRAFVGEGDEVIMPQYGFLVYPIATKASGATCVRVPQPRLLSDVDALLGAVTPKTKIVFLDNPGNPLGCLMPRDDVLRLHKGIPDSVILVLDEAYAEYVADEHYESGLTLFKDATNVITLRTFSKVYGLAGIRVGFGVGAPALLDPLNRIRPPFNVNSVGQAAASIAVHDQAWVKKAKDHNMSWINWTKERLEASCFPVNPSHGNFLLFDCGSSDGAKNVYRYLGEKGIMVRPMAGYGLHHHLRVSIGRDHEMEEFISVMQDYFSRSNDLLRKNPA
ncbi:MAG: histidinol-phosphate transaminase [Alphaproteobacteria bacterium]|nr:histidinol-phosphate transaminase [Alphaproteobacteria bacterium]